MTDQAKGQEYQEFIRVTREHQAERERVKKLERKNKKKQPAVEEYYIDVSQVNTLIEANLVEAPDKNDAKSRQQQRETQLIELYGSRDAYHKIRSMEMNIDEHFKSKCRKLNPHLWPVIPINVKPYLNPMRD